MYVFEMKNLRRITKKGQQRHEAKSKVRMMFFEVKMQQAI